MRVSKVMGYLLCGMILAAWILFFVENNALAEDVTITTYYPAPYGVYDSLLTNKLGVGDNDGDGNLASADVPTNSGEVWIKGDVIVAGSLDVGWMKVDNSCMSRMCKATCPPGYRVVGGGCEMHGGTAMDNRPGYTGYPSWERTWVCYGKSDADEDKVEATYAICIRVK